MHFIFDSSVCFYKGYFENVLITWKMFSEKNKGIIKKKNYPFLPSQWNSMTSPKEQKKVSQGKGFILCYRKGLIRSLGQRH